MCPTLCDPMDCSTPGLPVHHQLPEHAQTQVHWAGDATIYLYLSITLSVTIYLYGAFKNSPHPACSCQTCHLSGWAMGRARITCFLDKKSCGCSEDTGTFARDVGPIEPSKWPQGFSTHCCAGWWCLIRQLFQNRKIQGKIWEREREREREREKASKRGQCSPSWEECCWVLNKKHFVKNIFTNL